MRMRVSHEAINIVPLSPPPAVFVHSAELFEAEIMAESSFMFLLLIGLLVFFAGVPGGSCDVGPGGRCMPEQGMDRCVVDSVCSNGSNSSLSDEPFPVLPVQFSTTAQAVLLDETSKTFSYPVEISVREYFDDIGNRGRLDWAFNGSAGYSIFNYNVQEVYVVNSSGCFVSETTADNPILNRTFGLRQVDGAPHIDSVSEFFRIHNSSDLAFMGSVNVRGIPCNRWQSCFSSENKSYAINYYFAAEDANLTSAYGNKDTTPVQITVEGLKLDKDGDSIGRLNNIYTFVDFNTESDSVPDDIFRVPNGLVCKGRKSGTPLPSFPEYFSTSIEGVIEESQYVFVFKEYYDTVQQLVRRDTTQQQQRGSLLPGEYTRIYDYNLETGYTINRRYKNCSIFSINATESFETEVVDGRARLLTPADVFLIQDSSRFTYEGVTVVRGVEVDTWISYLDFKQYPGGANGSDIIEEVYFTRPNWTFSSGDKTPTLWRLKYSANISYLNSTSDSIESVQFSSTYDLFGFSNGEPDLDVFDTSVCYNPSDYVIIILHLPVKDISVDFSLLPRNVRAALSTFTQVQPLQIGNIQVLGGNETDLILSLHISNLSNISLDYVTAPVSANAAVDLLLKSAEKSKNRQLEVGICLSTEGCQFANPILSTVRRANGTVIHTFSGGNSDDDNNLSAGAIAGIVIWMFILGIGLGIIGTLSIMALIICLRKRGSITLPSVAYNRQHDEKVAVGDD